MIKVRSPVTEVVVAGRKVHELVDGRRVGAGDHERARDEDEEQKRDRASDPHP
jgi:hypothetical protein